MREDNRGSYRTVVKGTAIFGGVQAFNILINIIRGKCIALLLGPTGMGVASLFTSTSNTIEQFSSLGLNLGAIKELSEANESGDEKKLAKVVSVFRKLVVFTGTLAVLVAILGAPWISRIAFGNEDYMWGVSALSIVLFFSLNNSAETALLQGTRKLKFLATSSIIGAVIGLIVGVPLYYFFGVNGIVPAMIVLAMSSFFVNRYFTNKLLLTFPQMTTAEVFQEGKQMLTLGISLLAASLIGVITSYSTNVYVRLHGGFDDVGFYQAASSITNQYVGLIFTAMAVDYFPRLSSISNNKEKVQKVVSDQMDVVMLAVLPLLIAIIITAPLLIRILLAEKFLPIISVVRWLGLGLFFKTMSFPLGYISFSKGDKKMFFWMEGIYGHLSNLVLSIVGYSLWGLQGLGIAFTVSYILYVTILSIVVKYRYGFTIKMQLLKTILPSFVLLVASFLIFQIGTDASWKYAVTSVFMLMSFVYSYKMLDDRIGIKDLILSKIKKK